MARPMMSLCVTAVLLAVTANVRALYVRVETERVPVGRLVENLERQLAADPRNPLIHINLARLHGMAWALGAEEVPAAPGKTSDLEPWYGYEPDLIPYHREAVPGRRADPMARRHLDQALKHYESALELDPGSLLGNLGYGWMLQQAGQTTRAIERYRRVIEKAWPSEEQKRMAGPGARFFTNEAAGYLIPLLDPVRDAEEIATLRSHRAHFNRLPRAITPVAIPLRAGLSPDRIHDPAARVLFDADGSGLRREWTWITTEAAWLVYDAGRSGHIDSALQLFGSVSFWLFWENGYHALAALDDDRDAELAGDELKRVAVWHDANQNGISDRGEVRPVGDHGIAAISCAWLPGDGTDFAALSIEGLRTVTGEIRPTYDVLLRSRVP